MKKIMLLASAALAISVAAVLPDNPETLAIGSPAPKADLEMKGTSGELYSLRKVSGANGLVVIFTCNNCQFVVCSDGYGEGWEVRYGGINGACAKSNVGVIYVNSNEAKREKGDNLEDMKERAAANRYGDVPYVLDKNS
ncbi:MAG: thioredoxin family protein, partial [Bacteroidota bacterium]